MGRNDILIVLDQLRPLQVVIKRDVDTLGDAARYCKSRTFFGTPVLLQSLFTKAIDRLSLQSALMCPATWLTKRSAVLSMKALYRWGGRASLNCWESAYLWFFLEMSRISRHPWDSHRKVASKHILYSIYIDTHTCHFSSYIAPQKSPYCIRFWVQDGKWQRLRRLQGKGRRNEN